MPESLHPDPLSEVHETVLFDVTDEGDARVRLTRCEPQDGGPMHPIYTWWSVQFGNDDTDVDPVFLNREQVTALAAVLQQEARS